MLKYIVTKYTQNKTINNNNNNNGIYINIRPKHHLLVSNKHHAY